VTAPSPAQRRKSLEHDPETDDPRISVLEGSHFDGAQAEAELVAKIVHQGRIVSRQGSAQPIARTGVTSADDDFIRSGLATLLPDDRDFPGTILVDACDAERRGHV
jgi:hypothetical protein